MRKRKKEKRGAKAFQSTSWTLFQLTGKSVVFWTETETDLQKVKDTKKDEGQQNVWSKILQLAKTLQLKEMILRGRTLT